MFWFLQFTCEAHFFLAPAVCTCFFSRLGRRRIQRKMYSSNTALTDIFFLTKYKTPILVICCCPSYQCMLSFFFLPEVTQLRYVKSRVPHWCRVGMIELWILKKLTDHSLPVFIVERSESLVSTEKTLELWLSLCAITGRISRIGLGSALAHHSLAYVDRTPERMVHNERIFFAKPGVKPAIQ